MLHPGGTPASYYIVPDEAPQESENACVPGQEAGVTPASYYIVYQTKLLKNQRMLMYRVRRLVLHPGGTPASYYIVYQTKLLKNQRMLVYRVRRLVLHSG